MPAMDWRTTYANKLASPGEAVRLIGRGCRILIGSGAAEPIALVHALVEAGDHFADNAIVHLLTLGPAPYVAPEHQARFRHTAFFIGANVRDAVREGRADFLPVFLSEIPILIRSGRVPIDVALIQVSPPDRHGFVSLGVSVDVVRAAVDTAKLVLVEVNPRMPRTHGDSFVHVSRLDRLIPVDTPLLEHAAEAPGEVELAIGRHVAGLVADGATLQTGIGKIPDAVLSALEGRRGLGVHTEMLSDGIMRLAEAGVITGKRKSLLPGKMVTSFVMGSRQLYEWADEHPGLEMRPSDYTNDPAVIARNDNMVSINSALAVDLTGQVAADTVGGRFFSGIGGQVDFVRGAARSRGGKAIIALPSTAKGGTVSRIQPVLEAGAGIVTSRGDVRYVVTEYGVADLWGRSVRERAVALIDIAHPSFRDELLSAAKSRKYVFPDQVAPRAKVPFDAAGPATLFDGTKIVLRPVRITDEQPLQRMLYSLSDESTYRRFLSYKQAHPHAEMQRLVEVDYAQNMALVACAPESEDIVGIVRYDVEPGTPIAEIAFVVRDDWQGRGVGTAMLQRMAEIARAQGIGAFTADILQDNKPMLMVFHRSGLKLETRLDSGVYHVVVALGSHPGTITTTHQ
jgi:acyl-CoA hydrolase/GNAT superfamily N-acetyltransferase